MAVPLSIAHRFEVARQHEWTHFYDILSPVIRRPLHFNLQSQLHDLIRESFGPDPEVHLDCFKLLELEILTEFEHWKLWFPLQPQLKDTMEGLAVDIIRCGCALGERWGEAVSDFQFGDKGDPPSDCASFLCSMLNCINRKLGNGLGFTMYCTSASGE